MGALLASLDSPDSPGAGKFSLCLDAPSPAPEPASGRGEWCGGGEGLAVRPLWLASWALASWGTTQGGLLGLKTLEHSLSREKGWGTRPLSMSFQSPGSRRETHRGGTRGPTRSPALGPQDVEWAEMAGRGWGVWTGSLSRVFGAWRVCPFLAGRAQRQSGAPPPS